MHRKMQIILLAIISFLEFHNLHRHTLIQILQILGHSDEIILLLVFLLFIPLLLAFLMRIADPFKLLKLCRHLTPS